MTTEEKKQQALDALDKLSNLAFVNISNEKLSVSEYVELTETIRECLSQPATPEGWTPEKYKIEQFPNGNWGLYQRNDDYKLLDVSTGRPRLDAKRNALLAAAPVQEETE